MKDDHWMLLFMPCLSDFFLLERSNADTTYFHDNTLVHFTNFIENIKSLFKIESLHSLPEWLPKGQEQRLSLLAAVVCGDTWTVWGGDRQRETETETETDRQRQTETDRDRQREREKESERAKTSITASRAGRSEWEVRFFRMVFKLVFVQKLNY